MRLTITLILCAIVSMSGISGTHRLLNDILRRDKTETRKGDISISNRKVSRQLRHSVANNEFIPLMDPTLREDSEWQPERIEVYYDFGAGWELINTNHYAFNASGLRTMESMTIDGTTLECQYVFDELGRIMGGIRALNGDIVGKYEVEYDSVVTDQVVSYINYHFESNGEYIPSSGFKCEVERNGDGNVTSVKNFRYGVDQILHEVEYWTIEYGTDGRACKIEAYENLNYDEAEADWTLVATFYDIEWDRTDGQFFFISDFEEEYAPDIFMTGANRMKKAKAKDPEMPMALNLNATFDGEDYEMTLKFGSTLVFQTGYEFTDEYGSFVMTQKGFGADDENYQYNRIEKAYDCFGLETIFSFEEAFDPEFTMDYSCDAAYADIEYNAEFGYPETYTRYSGWNGRFQPDVRFVYSDYVKTNSVGSIADSAAQESYYTLQGIPVSKDALIPGIYIVHRGGNAFKRIIR